MKQDNIILRDIKCGISTRISNLVQASTVITFLNSGNRIEAPINYAHSSIVSRKICTVADDSGSSWISGWSDVSAGRW